MSYLTQAQSADPATPAVTKNILFPDTANRRPVSLDDKGVRNVLTARALPNYLRNSGFWFAQRQAPPTPPPHNQRLCVPPAPAPPHAHDLLVSAGRPIPYCRWLGDHERKRLDSVHPDGHSERAGERLERAFLRNLLEEYEHGEGLHLPVPRGSGLPRASRS